MNPFKRITNKTLSPEITLNGISVLPIVRYKGEDCSASTWLPWGYGNTLAVVGAGTAATLNVSSGLSGKFAKGVSFAGVATAKYYKDSATTLPGVGTNDFVIEFIFKVVNGSVASKFDASDGWNIWYTSPNLNIRLYNSTAFALVQTGNLTTGNYYHFLLICDRSGNGQWYVNGIASGGAVDISGKAETLNNTAGFALGYDPTAYAYGSGTLVYFSLWHSAGWLNSASQATFAAERYAKIYK